MVLVLVLIGIVGSSLLITGLSGLGFPDSRSFQSSCKKVMNKLQCRLVVLNNRLNSSAKHLREEIALALTNANHHNAYTKIEKLYMGENLKQVYELVDDYCGFVLANISYIKTHRKCPNDLKEAVSSLVFASVRMPELPELKEVRKLFEDRYGCKFVTIAAELLPGNLVNCQLKHKLLMKAAPEDSKSRLFKEILQDTYLKPVVAESEAINGKIHGYDRITSPVISQSSPSIMSEVTSPSNNELDLGTDDDTFSLPSLYLCDDIQEFKSPARKGESFLDDQDNRVFVFNEPRMRKRLRRRLSSINDYINDNQSEVYYSNSPSKQMKHRKKEYENVSLERDIRKQGKAVDGFAASFRQWLNGEEETETLSRRCNSRTEASMERPVEVSRSALSSPSHVHPKLPDCDEIEAMFKALKRKIISRAN